MNITNFESLLVNVAESDFGPLLTAVTMLNKKYDQHPVCAMSIEKKMPASSASSLSFAEKGSEEYIICKIHYQDPVVLFCLGQIHGMVVTKTKS